MSEAIDSEATHTDIPSIQVAVDGCFISPTQANQFEALLEKEPQNSELRWKLLGFILPIVCFVHRRMLGAAQIAT